MTINLNGEEIQVNPRAYEYIYNCNTCLDLEEPTTGNTLATISINLTQLPKGSVAVDDITYPDAIDFIMRNELGFDTGKRISRRTQSGFHEYPVYALDMTKLTDIRDYQ